MKLVLDSSHLSLDLACIACFAVHLRVIIINRHTVNLQIHGGNTKS